MIVVCLGLQRSGSTWLFNVVREVLKRKYGEVLSLEATSLEALQKMPSELNESGCILIRCHTVTGSLLNFLLASDARFVLSLRDPRDSIASLCSQLGGRSGNWCIDVSRSLAAIQTVRDRSNKALLFQFEDGYVEKPGSVQQLAKHLGVSLVETEVAEILALFSKESVQKYLDKVVVSKGENDRGGWKTDPLTGFNERHIGDGRIGKWRELPFPDEAEWVDRAFGAPDGVVRFVEPLFGMAAQPKGAERFASGASSVGERFIAPMYLPVGRWLFRASGDFPAWIFPFVARVVDGGRIVFEREFCSDMAAGSGFEFIDFSFELNHSDHDAAIELVVDGGYRTLPDPFRSIAVECLASKI